MAMDPKLKKSCDIFVDDWKIIKQFFKRDNERMTLAGSTVFSIDGKEPSLKQIRLCEDYVYEKTAKLSEFRGIMRVPVMCMMSKSKDYKAYFDKVQKISEILKPRKWLGEDYRVLASMILADCTSNLDKNIAYYIQETDKIYDQLKAHYSKKIRDKDYPFAAMLAATDFEIEPLLDDVFTCEEKLSKTFKFDAPVRALSYLLSSTEEEASVMRQKTIAIFRCLEKKQFKYGAGYDIVVMGALSFLDMEADEIANAFLDAENYLKMDKHLRGYTMKPGLRNLYAALTVWHAYRKKSKAAKELPFDEVVSMMVQTEVSIMASASSFFSFG